MAEQQEDMKPTYLYLFFFDKTVWHYSSGQSRKWRLAEMNKNISELFFFLGRLTVPTQIREGFCCC